MDSATTKRKKKRKSKNAIVENEGQSLDQKNTIFTGLTNNTAQGNLVMEKFKIEDEVEPIENLAEANVSGKRAKKRKRNARAEIEDGGNLTTSNIDPTKMDIGSTEISAEGNVIIENPKIQGETQSNGQAQSLVEGIDAGKRKEKKKRKKKAAVVDEVQQEMEENLDKPMVRAEYIADEKVIIENSKTQDEAQNLAEGSANGKRRKKRKKKKGIVNDEVHSERDATKPTEIGEGNVTLNEPAQTRMDAGSIENVTIENPKVQDEIQSIENPIRDEGNVNVTRKKKLKKKKMAKVEDEYEIQSIENRIRDEGNVTVTSKKKPKKKKKAKVKDELSGRIHTGSTENPAEVNVNISIPETRGEVHCVALKENLTKESVTFEIPKVLNEIQSIENPISDEGNVAVKRKKKPKKKKMAKVEDELSSRIDTGSTENLAEVNVNISVPETRGEVHSVALTENLTKDSANFEIPKVQDKIQSIENPIMDEGNVTVTRKKKPKKKKMAKVEDKLSGRIDTGSTENLAESNVNISIPGTRGEVHGVALKENLTKESVTFEIPKVQDEIQSIENPIRDEGNVTLKKKKKKKPRKKKAAEVMSLNGLSQVLDEGRSATSTCNEFAVKDAEVLCRRTVPFASLRRKLLVLDLNGLLADIIYDAPRYCQGDIKIHGRAVFKRPFCDDFLKFCFQNFYVGIWSSRTKRIIDPVVSFLLGDLEAKLVFCWDMTHCTKSGSNTLENRHKPLVCKDLRKIWQHDDPSWPWKKGDYNESNTLLLDDSPYKALLNPPHTAIFSHPYEYSHKNDNSLGPGGDLRVYLEGLVTSENVQKYVKEHPFGQMPISEQSMSWEFYNRVINKMSKLVNDEAPPSVVKA